VVFFQNDVLWFWRVMAPLYLSPEIDGTFYWSTLPGDSSWELFPEGEYERREVSTGLWIRRSFSYESIY
jgi:hypothetical protein